MTKLLIGLGLLLLVACGGSGLLFVLNLAPMYDAKKGHRRLEVLLPERLRERHIGFRAAFYSEGRQIREMGSGLELHGRRQDGSEFAVDIMLSGMPGVRGDLVMAVVRDITERKESDKELQVHSRQLEAFAKIAKVLAQSGSLENKSHRMLEIVVEVAGADMAAVRLPDKAADGLRLLAWAGNSDLPPQEISSYKSGFTAAAFIRGQPLIVNDYPSHELASSNMIAAGVKSGATFPIIANGEKLGSLTVNSRIPGHFTPERVRLLKTLVDDLGILLNQSSLQEDQRQRTQELEIMFRIANILAERKSFDEKTAAVLKEVLGAAEADAVSLRVPNESKETLDLIASAGDLGTPPAPSLSLPNSLSGQAYSQGKVIVVNDHDSHHLTGEETVRGGIRSSVFLPVFSHGRKVGVIAVNSVQNNYFIPDRVRLLDAITSGIGSLLEYARLAEAEQINTQVLNQMSEGVMLVRISDGVILYTNSRFEEMWGYGQGELLGKHVSMLNSSESGDPVETSKLVIDQLQESGHWSGEIRNVRKDGTAFWSQASVSVINHPRFGDVGISVQSDITSQKHWQGEITRLASFPELNPEPVFEVDLAGKVTYLNPIARRQLPDLANAKTEHPALEGLTAVASVLQSGGEDHVVREIEIDGRAFEQRISHVLEGGPIRVYMVDITERKQLLQQLLQTGKLAAVGTLISGVAHEVNNPLAGALGHLDLLLREDLNESITEDLQVARDETMRAVQIMRNLLSFARERKPEKTYVSVNEVLGDTLDLREYELTVSNISVERMFQSDLPKTMADHGQLQQVFLNLILNAEQAIAKAQNHGVITVGTKQRGDVIRVTVADDGPGIPKEILPKIFDPFFTTKQVGKGTGLGLSICYGIIEEHSGQIRVSSKAGKGATFTVELPIVPEGHPSPSPRGGGRRATDG